MRVHIKIKSYERKKKKHKESGKVVSRNHFLGFRLSERNYNQLWLWESLEDVSGI